MRADPQGELSHEPETHLIPNLLAVYGTDYHGAYSGDEEMFELFHAMRARIITSPSFNGDRILGSILFEMTMDRQIEGRGSANYLWNVKNVVPFLKVDKGLDEEVDGAQVMKPMPGRPRTRIALHRTTVRCPPRSVNATVPLDYLVDLADRVLRKNPRQLTFLAPIITYLMTFVAGTGFTAFATMPVITEVAKETNIRPSRPLSVAVVASQLAITASPISAVVVFFSGVLEKQGVDYLQLLAIAVPSTFIACMATAAIIMAGDKMRHTTELGTHPEYQRRLALGTVSVKGPVERHLLPRARLSVLTFAVGLVAVVGYSIVISEKVGLVTDPVMERVSAIIASC